MNKLLTVEQIAESAQVSTSKVYAWIRAGELPALDVCSSQRKGGRPRLRVRQRDWERFQSDRYVPAKGEAPDRERRRPGFMKGVPDYV